MAKKILVRYHSIEDCVEAICNKGCQAVRSDIDLLRRGGCTPELQGFSAADRQRVLKELQTIMDVYGDSCRIY